MNDDEIITTKEAVKALFQECGGYKAVAHTLDISLARAYAFTDEASHHHNLSFKRAAQLTTPKSPALAHYLARNAGGTFRPLTIREGKPLALISDAVQSHSNVVTFILAAMADGEVTREEATEIVKLIEKSLSDLASLRKSLVDSWGEE
jgi:hypothetical protein